MDNLMEKFTMYLPTYLINYSIHVIFRKIRWSSAHVATVVCRRQRWQLGRYLLTAYRKKPTVRISLHVRKMYILPT